MTHRTCYSDLFIFLHIFSKRKWGNYGMQDTLLFVNLLQNSGGCSCNGRTEKVRFSLSLPPLYEMPYQYHFWCLVAPRQFLSIMKYVIIMQWTCYFQRCQSSGNFLISGNFVQLILMYKRTIIMYIFRELTIAVNLYTSPSTPSPIKVILRDAMGEEKLYFTLFYHTFM